MLNVNLHSTAHHNSGVRTVGACAGRSSSVFQGGDDRREGGGTAVSLSYCTTWLGGRNMAAISFFRSTGADSQLTLQQGKAVGPTQRLQGLPASHTISSPRHTGQRNSPAQGMLWLYKRLARS